MHDYIAAELLKGQQEQTHLLRELARTTRSILNHLHNNVTGGTVRLQGEPPMTPITPGSAPQFSVTIDPANATFIPSDSVWSTSDPANFPVAPSTDGLSAVVNVQPGVAVGTQFTVTWAYTNADGTVATGDIVETVVAPVVDVTGGTIEQSA